MFTWDKVGHYYYIILGGRYCSRKQDTIKQTLQVKFGIDHRKRLSHVFFHHFLTWTVGLSWFNRFSWMQSRGVLYLLLWLHLQRRLVGADNIQPRKSAFRRSPVPYYTLFSWAKAWIQLEDPIYTACYLTYKALDFIRGYVQYDCRLSVKCKQNY